MPGSRWCMPVIALNRWVKPRGAALQRLRRRPRSCPACGRSGPGSRRRRSARSARGCPAAPGASVISRIGASACSARISSSEAARAKSGCAPSLPGLMYGPSRCTPSTRARRSARARGRRAPALATPLRSSASGAVIVVASSEVVPWRACSRAMRSIASPPSMCRCPPPPCTCRSMKPGSTSACASALAWSSVRGVPSIAGCGRLVVLDRAAHESLRRQDVALRCASALTLRASFRPRSRSSRCGSTNASARPPGPVSR